MSGVGFPHLAPLAQASAATGEKRRASPDVDRRTQKAAQAVHSAPAAEAPKKARRVSERAEEENPEISRINEIVRALQGFFAQTAPSRRSQEAHSLQNFAREMDVPFDQVAESCNLPVAELNVLQSMIVDRVSLLPHMPLRLISLLINETSQEIFSRLAGSSVADKVDIESLKGRSIEELKAQYPLDIRKIHELHMRIIVDLQAQLSFAQTIEACNLPLDVVEKVVASRFSEEKIVKAVLAVNARKEFLETYFPVTAMSIVIKHMGDLGAKEMMFLSPRLELTGKEFVRVLDEALVEFLIQKGPFNIAHLFLRGDVAKIKEMYAEFLERTPTLAQGIFNTEEIFQPFTRGDVSDLSPSEKEALKHKLIAKLPSFYQEVMGSFLNTAFEQIRFALREAEVIQ